jgi:hypothetical protein
MKILEERLDLFLKAMKQAFVDTESKHKLDSATDDSTLWEFLD